MTNSKHIKRALFSSMIALLLCFTMLLGTTFAWFTDEVTSRVNIIQTGELKVGLYWAEGEEDIPRSYSSKWQDASQTAIFNSYDSDHNEISWEPGFIQARHVKIKNEGDLALKYKVLITPTSELTKLADVIEVYYFDTAVKITDRSMLTENNYLGTLSGLLSVADADGIAYGALLPSGQTPTEGTNEVEGAKDITIVLKMKEDAGNDYQKLSICSGYGNGLSVQVLATQYSYEADSLNDKTYDSEAPYAETVTVTDSASLYAAIANAPVGVPTQILVSDNVAVDNFEALEAPEGTDVTLLIAGSINVTASNDTLEGIYVLGASGYPMSISGSNVTVKDSTFVGGSNYALTLKEDTVDSITNIDNCVFEEYYTLDENGNKVYSSYGSSTGLNANPNGTLNITNTTINVKGSAFRVGPSNSGYNGYLNVSNSNIDAQTVSISTVNSAKFTDVTFDYTWYDGTIHMYAGAKVNTFERCEFKEQVDFFSSNNGGKDVVVEINNCTFNGVAITAENVTEYFEFTNTSINSFLALNTRDNLTLKVNGTTVTLS